MFRQVMDHLNVGLRRCPTWCLYLLGGAPAPWLFYLGVTGALGVDPVKAIEHRYGELALQFLVASLAITPLRKHIGLNLMKFRRAVGLLSFFYVFCHLLVWLILDVQILSQILADIFKRPFVTIGMVSFTLLLPLALTSNTASIRRLGANWRRLHRLAYPAAILAAIHYIWLAKGIQIEPLVYLGVISALLLLRVPAQKLSKHFHLPASARRKPYF